MKYIRFRDAGIVLFAKRFDHDVFAARFENDKPISAGFVIYNYPDKTMVCYGESMTLGLKSCEDDSIGLNRMLDV